MSRPEVNLINPQETLPDNAKSQALVNNVNTAYRVGIMMVVVLSGFYALFPLDAIPDMLPIAGQADDAAVVAAGGGSAAMMTAGRFALMLMLHNRRIRSLCLMSSVILFPILIGGALLMFYGLYNLVNNLF